MHLIWSEKLHITLLGMTVKVVLILSQIRKAAQHAIGAILRGSRFMTTENAPHFHPIANDTSTFCNKILENTKGRYLFNINFYHFLCYLIVFLTLVLEFIKDNRFDFK